MKRLCALALWVIATAASADGLAPLTPGAKIAFLGMQFTDSSTEGAYNGVRADETARHTATEDYVAERFAEEGFALIDTAPAAEQMARHANLAHCFGCELRIAEKLGADYVLTGETQKVSNLILSMNLVLKDVKSGDILRARVVDFRSNTDATWRRAARYILNNHVFAAPKE